MTEIHTQEEAIAFLRQEGFIAKAREWAMGPNTIFLTHPSLIFTPPGMRIEIEVDAYRRAAYLMPKDNRWELSMDIEYEVFDSFDEAFLVVKKYLLG